MNTTVWLAGVVLAASRVALAQNSDSAASAARPNVQLSGYVTSSYTYATKPRGNIIIGRLYDRFHDEVQLDAARVTLEHPVATDKFEAGFRVDAVFGQNATPLRSAGLTLGDQGDLPQAFVTLNVPTGKGTYVQFKAGKMWTLLDVEVIDEVLNPNFSHGYQFIYLTNFTNTGLGVDAKLSPMVDAQLRLVNGWDVVEDNNTRRSFMGRIGFAPSANVSLSFLGYYGPEQTDNPDAARYGGEFVGMFKPTSKATLYAQGDVGGEQGLGSGGAAARWYGIGAWGTIDVSPTLAVAVRCDYLNDLDGVRTSGVLGFDPASQRKIGSDTVTLNVKTWDHALVRPEIRLEHSNLADFGNAGDRSTTQVTFGVALSYLF